MKKQLKEFWTIGYRGLRFKISPTGFKHTGLFPEQAANWDFIYEKIQGKKDVKILDLSVVLDNLVSNSKKASATEVIVDFSNEGRKVIMTFSDNGVGVDLNQYSAESIFEPGVTNRRGGSGIGLHTIRHYMQTSLNGDIQFSGNGLEYDKGATFKLIFY